MIRDIKRLEKNGDKRKGDTSNRGTEKGQNDIRSAAWQGQSADRDAQVPAQGRSKKDIDQKW
jgi:hypothetical protein